jgi:hypothetical protein
MWDWTNRPFAAGLKKHFAYKYALESLIVQLFYVTAKTPLQYACLKVFSLVFKSSSIIIWICKKVAEKTINLIRFIFIIQSLKCITKLSLVGMQLSEGPSFHPLLRRRAFARNIEVLLIFFMFCNCIPTNESFVIIGTTYTGTDSLLIHFFSMTVTAQQLAQWCR